MGAYRSCYCTKCELRIALLMYSGGPQKLCRLYVNHLLSKQHLNFRTCLHHHYIFLLDAEAWKHLCKDQREFLFPFLPIPTTQIFSFPFPSQTVKTISRLSLFLYPTPFCQSVSLKLSPARALMCFRISSISDQLGYPPLVIRAWQDDKKKSFFFQICLYTSESFSVTDTSILGYWENFFEASKVRHTYIVFD